MCTFIFLCSGWLLLRSGETGSCDTCIRKCTIIKLLVWVVCSRDASALWGILFYIAEESSIIWTFFIPPMAFSYHMIWQHFMCICAQSLQVCPSLCDPTSCSLPCSCVYGILQERTWNRSPCPPPRDLLNPWIKVVSPALQAHSSPLNHQGSPQKCWHTRINSFWGSLFLNVL